MKLKLMISFLGNVEKVFMCLCEYLYKKYYYSAFKYYTTNTPEFIDISIQRKIPKSAFLQKSHQISLFCEYYTTSIRDLLIFLYDEEYPNICLVWILYNEYSRFIDILIQRKIPNSTYTKSTKYLFFVNIIRRIFEIYWYPYR